ncbi:uncharacterized protein LOC128886382 [Hylaeus anthracinus]|uniref:uncharacterized protein LOC128886382 n=1 Tax=Hylaeus anthracinus TaxID=313031 RepID=UPI0023B92FCA|nr:uncharacterized protein LOC128886382 [Hylaeus anthracinus]
MYNDEDEFEPRITPKPASKLDCFTVPSVPEVSLVFDECLNRRTTDYKGFHSPTVEPKGSIQKNNVSSPLNTNGSYSAWKEQNYLRRSSVSKVNECAAPQKVHYNQNYIAEPYLPQNISRESKGRDYNPRKDYYNSPKYKEQQTYRGNNDSSCKHSYQMCNDNAGHVEKKQNMSHAVKPCTNIDNYTFNQKEYSPLMHERKLTVHNCEQQKVPFNNSVDEPIVHPSINSNALNRNEIQLPHYLGQQYPYFNTNAYPFPQLHSYPTQNGDSQETIKNLLQIINSQNEQIKSLQIQVDRLLKMQEANLQDRKNCFCSSQIQQKDQVYTTCNDNTTGASNYVRTPQNIKRHAYQCEPSKDKEKENSNEHGNLNQTELILAEAQSRKTFMEQKVSIGVMTSFEFTVQNSPFTVDVDERKDCQQDKGNLKMCNNVGLHDTNESLRRYKNSFTRIPSAQLENIVEDSESYMSSSQQQSSNLNASVSIKDLEKQPYTDIRKGTDIHRSESPKLCKATITKSNQPEIAQKHLERINTEEAKNYENAKTIQQNAADYNVPRSSNCIPGKANIPTNTDQYTKLNLLRNNETLKTSNSVESSTNYYKDCRKEGQVNNAKPSSCVEYSMILNGGDLRINERPPPTPEPSIHIEMQEYSSDDDSEKVKRSSKVGWTFYNNVLGQVNHLLQNSCVIDDQQQDKKKENQNEKDESENRALDTVKVATLEQLKKLGISLSENPEHKELNNSNKMAFDLSFYPRLDYQANMTQTSAVNETNTSMHMKALALKYLSDEQLAELAVQRQGATSVKHLMVSNVQGTNMSFATMRYLERYQLLPGKNNIPTEDISKVHVEAPPKVDLKFANPKNSPVVQRYPFSQTPRTTCPSKILDISTLKQQPKLL